IERGDRVIERGDRADVSAQTSVAHALDDLSQLSPVGLDDEVDGQSIGGLLFRRPDDRDQDPARLDEARRPFSDVPAEEIEPQVAGAAVCGGTALEVDDLAGAEVERGLTIGGASGADNVGAELVRELSPHRPDSAGCAVRDAALPRPKVPMFEQALP